MTQKIIRLLSACVLISAGFQACDFWDEDINVNPNASYDIISEDSSGSDIEPSVLMADMIYLGAWGGFPHKSNASNAAYQSWNVSLAVCQYVGKRKSFSDGQRHRAWHERTPLWSGLYFSVGTAQTMKNLAESRNENNYLAVAKIWQSWCFALLTNLWGDIPYYDAMQKGEDATIYPKYDKQEDIYPAILQELKEASDLIASSKMPINPISDIIYNGDITKWQKLANTMRVRLAMYMYDANPELSTQILNEIVNNPGKYPVFESNDDNTYLRTDIVLRPSLVYKLPKKKIDEHAISDILIERLVSLKDPRLPVFAKPVTKTHLDEDDPENWYLPKNEGIEKYVGHFHGFTIDNDMTWNGGIEYVSTIGEYWRTEDANGTALPECADVPVYLALYSELQFFLAEAAHRGIIAGSSEDYYRQGILASFEQFEEAGLKVGLEPFFSSAENSAYYKAYGKSGHAGSDEYLSQGDVALGSSGTGGHARAPLAQIAEQKWIASFMLVWEPYFDHRRTMLPDMRVSNGARYNYPYAPGGDNSAEWFPARQNYSVSEFATNNDNVTEAANRMANADNGYCDPRTRMWIIKNTNLEMKEFEEPASEGSSAALPSSAQYSWPGQANFKEWNAKHPEQAYWWLDGN